MTSGSGDRGQQRRHGGQHDRAGGGDDHERHRPQQRPVQGVAQQQRDHEYRDGRRDHGDRVPLLDLLDEQLGPGFRAAGFVDQGGDPGDNRFGGAPVHPNTQCSGAVECSGENLVADALVDRERFAGDGGLIDLTAPCRDGGVGGDSLTGPDDQHIGDLEIGDRHGLFAVGVDAGSGVGCEVEQAADGILGAGGGESLQRAGGGEDDDQQRAVGDLADRRRADGGHHHQEIHIEGSVAKCPQACQARLPAAGAVAAQIQRPPQP